MRGAVRGRGELVVQKGKRQSDREECLGAVGTGSEGRLRLGSVLQRNGWWALGKFSHAKEASRGVATTFLLFVPIVCSLTVLI